MTRLAEWWSGGSTIEVDGHAIFTQVEGSGPTVVFLHGFPTSSHDWAGVIASLRDCYRCVTFDYLGYGASEKPTDADYSALLQTDRALAILASLGVTEADVVAHDLGGILLQDILHRQFGGRLELGLRQAIFMNSSVYAGLYRPSPAQLALADPVQGPMIAQSISRTTLEDAMAPLFPSRQLAAPELDDMWDAIRRANGQLLWPQHLVYMAERSRLSRQWEATLSRTSIKLGFVYGAADPISGGAIIERASAELPNARVTALADLGHFPQLERPDEVADALAELLG
ncbi:alpha/beta hydrolase [Bradyrhizobium sp. Arg237L]|uniref:alpha/beta fold hydrolase n=1 Tax=Bradyrhizobium sp. Arg237L TaxID=3003352 RepID=UPI00249DA56F|nr:alpha/beta hydrolase [Bradyrhizobium sp. Arg237L]MDI4234101.1 alpha/beta hydrolase [Bradyrhizobium sp. Arg237L]